MNTTTNGPATWSDEANEKGLQAWRDAEARLRASRSPAELAREPLPEETARLDELQKDLDVALAAVAAAKQAMADALPADVEAAPNVQQVGGVFSFMTSRPAHAWKGRASGDTDAYQRAKLALEAAFELEGEARSALTTAEVAVSEAGQRRFVAMTQKEASR